MNSQLPANAVILDDDFVDFPELWRTLGRYKWRVLGVTGVFALLGYLVAFSTEPVYRAYITILVEARPNQVVQVQEVYDPGFGTNEYYMTQTELVRSRDIAGRVVDRLNLSSNPSILPPPQASFWSGFLSGSWLPFIGEPEPAESVEEPLEEKRQRAIDALLARVSVYQPYRTQLLRASVDLESPQLAADIANSLGDVYVNSGLDSRMEATERATRWLTERLSDLRVRLDDSEKALQVYREQHQLVNVGGARGLAEEEVVDNARKLRDAQRKKTELASTYWKIQQAGNDDEKLEEVSALLLDPTVQKAGANLMDASQAVKQLEERYGAKHPQMTTARARAQAAKQAYLNQLRLAANGVKAEYEIAAETERALSGVVQTGKAQIRKLDQNEYQLRALERDVQTNAEMYSMFLKRYKETDTESTFAPMNARMVDRATVPKFPVKPQKSRIVTLWALAGFVIGVVLAALRHLLVETIKSPDQLEKVTQLPVLSVLPPVPGAGRKTNLATLCIERPRAPFPEGVRSIRASLHLSDVDKRMKRVMFTSALPQEGKSSISSCFAAVLGHSERVVLVEADLRAPTLKKLFDIPKEAPGLVELLTGQAKIDQAIYKHAATHVHVLPVAKIPANPAEVISSAAFSKLLDLLATHYDRVIVDTPPCQVASDSLLLAHKMDAVLFVAHGAKTGLRTIQAAVKHLRAAQAPLLGFVLNRVDARKAFGYDGGYYVYGHYGTYGQ